MPRYEAHITLDKEYAAIAQDLAEKIPGPWVYSAITGCPILGQGTYCYLTSYDESLAAMHFRLEQMRKIMVWKHQIVPLRMKIERIVFDTKTEINEIDLRLHG